MKQSKSIKVTLEIPKDLYNQIKTMSSYLIKKDSRLSPEKMLSDILTMALLSSSESAEKFIAKRQQEEKVKGPYSYLEVKKLVEESELDRLSKLN